MTETYEERIRQDAKMLSLSSLSFPSDIPSVICTFPKEAKQRLETTLLDIKLPDNVTLFKMNGKFAFDLKDSEGKTTGVAVALYREFNA
jgi:hypothetical protein